MMDCPLSFMTLGCPHWSLGTVIARAVEYGFDGIDFRGVGGELAIWKLPEFSTELKVTRRRLQDAGLRVSGLSTSIRLCDRNATADIMEESRRTIDLAHALATKNIRIFGGALPSGSERSSAAEAAHRMLAKILSLDGAGDLQWNVETHDAWIASSDILQLVDGSSGSNVGIVWDIAHTCRLAGEPPEQTCAAIGNRVRYVHLKDAAIATGKPGALSDGWCYMPMGQGVLPLESALNCLLELGFKGWIIYEHEKWWLPQLDEPEVVLPAFMCWMRRFEQTRRAGGQLVAMSP